MGKNSLVSIIYEETAVQLFGFAYDKPPLCVLDGIDSPPYVSYVDNKQTINVGGLINNKPLNQLIASLIDLLLKIEADRTHIRILSRNGTYANENYKIFANSKGVFCVFTGYNEGWYVNKDCDIVNRISQMCQLKIASMLNQVDTSSSESNTGDNLKVVLPVSERSSYTYICPVCGKQVHTENRVNIFCGDCNVALVTNS